MKIKLVLQYKINLKEKSNIKYKDDHRSMMKGKIHQKNIAHKPTLYNIASKYIQHKLMELQREINTFTTILGELNISFRNEEIKLIKIYKNRDWENTMTRML